MKYVFLFVGTKEGQKAWEEMSEEDRNKGYAHLQRWFAENSSKITHNAQLQPPHTATTVHFQENGEPIVRDGPFIEANEIIGGYTEVEVADLDEALRLAKTWPTKSTIEIRPVVER